MDQRVNKRNTKLQARPRQMILTTRMLRVAQVCPCRGSRAIYSVLEAKWTNMARRHGPRT